MNAGPAVEAIDLVKHFGDNVAVDGVSFVVPQGTVLGLLGPNGAGKTTTVRMLTTLSVPTSGTGRGGRPRHRHGARRRPPQHGADRPGGHGRRAAHRPREHPADRPALRPAQAVHRATATDELLERFSLTDAADRIAKTYSGGMRRRLDLAVSLIAAPPVLFLDEPTTGLDPRSRTELWEVLRGARARRHHAAAHHAVPRGGRPPGRRDHRDRQGQGHRRRHADRSSRTRPGAASVVLTVTHAADLPRAEELLRALLARGARRAEQRAGSPPRPTGSAT